MDIEVQRYYTFARFNRVLLSIIGVWPHLSLIRKYISLLLVLTSTFIVASTVANFCFNNLKDVMLLTRGMGLAVSFFATFMKVCLFVLHRDDLDYLTSVLTKRYEADLQNPDNLPLMLDHYKIFTNIMYPHYVFLTITMILYSLGPLIELRKHGEFGHVFPQVYPIVYEDGGAVFWFFYGLEFIAALSLSFVNTGIDCIFAQFAIMICDELRILGKCFNVLRYSDDFKKDLKQSVNRHYMLLSSKKHMESLYGVTTIYTAVSSALVICSLMFQVTEIAKTQTSYLYIVQLCCYIFPKLLQIFTYAWHGNLITDESGTCLYSMYNSAWPDTCNPHVKNDILIILTQEPLALLAKGCMLVQLDMFTKVVKASVSYFCILKTLNEAAED